MNAEQTLAELSAQADDLRALLATATQELALLQKRLEQIVQQLRKNIEVRDQAFAADFNAFCQTLRGRLDQWELPWAQVRKQAREIKPAAWSADLTLDAKGFNSTARSLSRSNDEFTTIYSTFNRVYKGFTVAKLNVFLLTSCQTDAENWTSKILFLAREITKNTERNRRSYVRG